MARVQEEFAAKKAAQGRGSDDEADDDELGYSGAHPPVVKSYKRAKFSSANTMEVVDAAPPITEGVTAAGGGGMGGSGGTEILELKDGEAFLAAATGTDKDGHKLKVENE